VSASGGGAGPGDLLALAALEPQGLEGVIVGKALYAGRLTVAEALAALASPAPGAAAASTASGGQPPAEGGPA
jgi:phosphoribosylanthranilate isomerase